MLQGQRDLAHRRPAAADANSTPLVNAQLGVIYQVESDDGAEPAAARRPMPTTARTAIRARCGFGEGLIGQCAADKRRMLITDDAAARGADRLGAVQGGAAATSSCCRCCSRTRSRR